MADLRLDVVSEKRGTGFEDQARASKELQGAQDALAHKIAEVQEAWNLLTEGLEKAFEVGKEALKLFQEQEKQDRLLALATGELADALKEQAESLERSLGVDAAKTEQMQALLYRFGEAPDKIDATVRALVDYSTVTGVDALQAAEHLTSSVNTGRDAFKELGIQYEKTNEKSHDIEAATKALTKALGGSAEAVSEGLEGQTKRASAEWENLLKGLGKGIDYWARATGGVNFMAQALAKFNDLFKADDPIFKTGQEISALESERNAIQAMIEARERLLKLKSEGNLGYADAGLLSDYNKQLQGSEKRLSDIAIKIEEKRGLIEYLGDKEREKELPGVNPNDGKTAKGKQVAEEAAKKQEELNKKAFENFAKNQHETLAERVKNATRLADIEAKDAERSDNVWNEIQDAKWLKAKHLADALEKLAFDRTTKEAEMERQHVGRVAAIAKEKNEALRAIELDAENKRLAIEQETTERLAKVQEDALRKSAVEGADKIRIEAEKERQEKTISIEAETQKRLIDMDAETAKQRVERNRAAAEQMGQDLVQEVGGALAKLAHGDKVDWKQTLGSILTAGLSIGGNLLLPGVGGAAGSALGGIFTGLLTRHEGGWIGAPYFHSGGWPGLANDERPIIARDGERVLSPGEVATMGGPRAVDAAAQGRGGGGINITINTTDAYTTKEWVERGGGRGMVNAVRTGKGNAALLWRTA